MKDYKLTRTGDVALAFTGEVLAEAQGRWHAGVEQNRWHDIAVYRTAAGKYVVQIIYRTQWQGETNYHTVEVVDSPGAVEAVLQGYLPLDHLLGYPAYDPSGPMAEKQARLRRSLEDRYRDSMTNVLDALGITEHVD